MFAGVLSWFLCSVCVCLVSGCILLSCVVFHVVFCWFGVSVGVVGLLSITCLGCLRFMESRMSGVFIGLGFRV